MLRSTLSIQELRQGNIEESSRDNYLNSTVSFLFWLYTYNPNNEYIVGDDIEADHGAVQDGLQEQYACPLAQEFKAFMDELNPNFTNPQYKKQIKSYIKDNVANPIQLSILAFSQRFTLSVTFFQLESVMETSRNFQPIAATEQASVTYTLYLKWKKVGNWKMN
jgi:hypothetical protein